MYSRAAPFEKSDNLIGTHQKIDRAARLTLRETYKKTYNENLDDFFPKINLLSLEILLLRKTELKFNLGKSSPYSITQYV